MRHVKARRSGYEHVAVGIRTCGGCDTNVWRTGYERVADVIRTCGGRDTNAWRTRHENVANAKIQITWQIDQKK